jgi:hypothetical protein
MKFVLLFYFMLSVLSLEPKLCVNCKFFKKELLLEDRFGKCLKSPKVNDVDYFLVSGVKPSTKKEYNFCSIVRKYNPECGPEGKLFEQKERWFNR